MSALKARQGAFSLVEMALVLLIIGLLTKSAIAPLAALQEHGKRRAAEQQLLGVHEAVVAHLVAYGILPCPLSESSIATGQSYVSDDLASHNPSKACTDSFGYVPARQLRLSGALSEEGALLDPWGRKLLFAVSLSDSMSAGTERFPDWTTPGEASQVGIVNLSADLVICNSQARGNCSGSAVRADQIAFVLLSTGVDNSREGMQSENLDNDRYFLMTEESIVKDRQFDDLVVWASAADVMYWMLRMGWLP